MRLDHAAEGGSEHGRGAVLRRQGLDLRDHRGHRQVQRCPRLDEAARSRRQGEFVSVHFRAALRRSRLWLSQLCWRMTAPALAMSRSRSSTAAVKKFIEVSSTNLPSRIFCITEPITACGRSTTRAAMAVSVSFNWPWARTPPVLEGDAVMVSTGFPVSLDLP